MNLQAGYKENTISQSNGFCKIRACVWGWSCFDRPAHESIHTGQEFNHTAARFLHGPLVLCFQAACKGVAIGWWWAGLQGDSSSFSYKISRSKIRWEGFYCLNLHKEHGFLVERFLDTKFYEMHRKFHLSNGMESTIIQLRLDILKLQAVMVSTHDHDLS